MNPINYNLNLNQYSNSININQTNATVSNNVEVSPNLTQQSQVENKDVNDEDGIESSGDVEDHEDLEEEAAIQFLTEAFNRWTPAGKEHLLFYFQQNNGDQRGTYNEIIRIFRDIDNRKNDSNLNQEDFLNVVYKIFNGLRDNRGYYTDFHENKLEDYLEGTYGLYSFLIECLHSITENEVTNLNPNQISGEVIFNIIIKTVLLDHTWNLRLIETQRLIELNNFFEIMGLDVNLRYAKKSSFVPLNKEELQKIIEQIKNAFVSPKIIPDTYLHYLEGFEEYRKLKQNNDLSNLKIFREKHALELWNKFCLHGKEAVEKRAKEEKDNIDKWFGDIKGIVPDNAASGSNSNNNYDDTVERTAVAELRKMTEEEAERKRMYEEGRHPSKRQKID